MADHQLTGTLLVSFLYSDDFKHNKIQHKMTGGLVSAQGWPLNTVKKKNERKTNIGLLQNIGGCLMQGTNYYKHLYERKIRTLKTGHFNRGWLLNTWPF